MFRRMSKSNERPAHYDEAVKESAEQAKTVIDRINSLNSLPEQEQIDAYNKSAAERRQLALASYKQRHDP